MGFNPIKTSGYLWFQDLIKTLDVLSYLNIVDVSALQYLPKSTIDTAVEATKSKLKWSSNNQFHSLQANALLAYNAWNGQVNAVSCDNIRQWTVLKLNTYQQISVSVDVCLKTTDFLVMSTIIKYSSNYTVYVYCVYDDDVSANELSGVPLAVFALYEYFDLYNHCELQPVNDTYRCVDPKNGIQLVVGIPNMNVLGCYLDQPEIGDTAAELFAKLLDATRLKSVADGVSGKIQGSKNSAMLRLKGNANGFSVADTEAKWLSRIFDVSENDAIVGVDRIVKMARKGANIKIFNEHFEVLDIMQYSPTIVMIRTTFKDESSQFVMLFEIADNVRTLAFFIVDVFPHEGASKIPYLVKNNIQDSSVPGVTGQSKVSLTKNNNVQEEITLAYRDLEFKILDTVSLADEDEDKDEEPEEETNSVEELSKMTFS